MMFSINKKSVTPTDKLLDIIDDIVWVEWISWFSLFISLILSAGFFYYYEIEFNIFSYILYTLIFYFGTRMITVFINRPNLLFDSELNHAVDELFGSAEAGVTIISAYIDFGKRYLNQLEMMLKDEVVVLLLFNTDCLQKPETKEQLERLAKLGAELFHNPNLHTKLFFNNHMVISTSMNFTQSSFNNSFESGYVTYEHKRYINDAWRHFNRIVESEDTIPLLPEDIKVDKGYCIRTKKEIPLNINKPIQYTEYRSSGRNYNGKYCHKCGSEAKGIKVGNTMCASCV